MFLLSQNDENQSENGSKNSKIRLRARPPAEPQKKMLQTKKLKSKSWKTPGFFHFSLADFGRARSRTGVFRTVFYSVFWRRASRPIKNRRFWPKNAPPPGKPVTFYECHLEDHAPAPSVRADFQRKESISGLRNSFKYIDKWRVHCWLRPINGVGLVGRQRWRLLWCFRCC